MVYPIDRMVGGPRKNYSSYTNGPSMVMIKSDQFVIKAVQGKFETPNLSLK